MSEPCEFRRVAIVGAGLIGASFGAAVARVRPGVSILAYDRPEVLHKLRERRPDWETSDRLDRAVRGADLVYVALPVGAAIEMLPEILAQCDSDALVTDAGSTKARICAAAREHARKGAKFLAGHPIAGKELRGIENADATLFAGKQYVLVSEGGNGEEQSDPRVKCFVELLRQIGSQPVWMDAEMHDWAMAVVSQMPQLVAIALARVISDETDETGLPLSLAGSGLRDLLRTAGSPYDIWRDICLTNRENITRSLDRAAQAIEFLRAHLTSRELETEFQGANELYDALHGKFPANGQSEEPVREVIGKAGANG